ncbi:MAG: glycosyltransferase family 4 protein [Candidatus Omnitrophota bacterium]
MKILFLSRDYPPNAVGGVGTYIYEISRLLCRMGHRAFVITHTDDLPLEYTDRGVRVFRVKPKKIKFLSNCRPRINGLVERLEYSLAVSEKMRELFKREQIDIVESCEARAEGFWHYLFRKTPPLIIKLHTPETLIFKLDHPPLRYDYALIKLLEKFWISRAALKIGISKEVVDLTARHFSLDLSGISLIPNPVDLELFKPSDKPIEADNFDILYAGRLEFRKGVHTLMRAFLRVQEKIPEARLILVGADCGMKPYLQDKAAQLKDPQKVIFVGYVSRCELVSYYQGSAVCIVPSIWENYPYVCLEAMACGKAVIASRLGGIKEMINHADNGLLFSPGSTKELSEQIINLLKDRQKMSRLGRNARKYMEEKFNPETIARKTLSIYEKLVEVN